MCGSSATFSASTGSRRSGSAISIWRSTRSGCAEKSAPATPSNLKWVKGAPAAKAEPAKSGHTAVAKSEPKKAVVAETKPVVRSGWIIQIGATDDIAKAKELLSRAKDHSRTIAKAQPFTEKVQKGSETLWRARFAGLQENAAESACRELKRSGMACFAMKN